MKMATSQSLYLERFAQDNGIYRYVEVLQRPNLEDFVCILVRTGSALDSYSPLKLWRVTQRLAINEKSSGGTRLRHCVYLATMSPPPCLAPSLGAR